MIAQQNAKTTINELRLLIKTARQVAVFNQTIVTFCPSEDGNKCSSKWSAPLMIFEDPNRNERLDYGEKLHQQSTINLTNAILSWRSLNSYIQFSAEGSTRATSGSMRYCPKDESKAHLYKKLVVSVSGRTRNEQTDTTAEHSNFMKNFGC